MLKFVLKKIFKPPSPCFRKSLTLCVFLRGQVTPQGGQETLGVYWR